MKCNSCGYTFYTNQPLGTPISCPQCQSPQSSTDEFLVFLPGIARGPDVGMDLPSFAVPSQYVPSSSGIIGGDALFSSAPIPSISVLDDQYSQLKGRIRDIHRELEAKEKKIKQLEAGTDEHKKEIESLNAIQSRLSHERRLLHFQHRVNSEAWHALTMNDKLVNEFQKKDLRPAFVISIDIRRSTDLMLKATDPQSFAEFITGLCRTLQAIILDTLGVFDKFTGDGILAFYPEFFSGPDMGMRAVAAAQRCHKAFEEHYRVSRKHFSAVPLDVGLGIGIDYGKVSIVQLGLDLTVVGSPVVYACRMNGREGGTTLLNQPAYAIVFQKYSTYCSFEETSINFKHEGNMLAYRPTLNAKPYTYAKPDWLSEYEKAKGSKTASGTTGE